MINKDNFNITGWDYRMVDSEHFIPVNPDYNISTVAEVFVDVDYKDAKHKVSFYCMIDDKNNIKEEVDEFMSAAIKSSCNDDLFYEQLESTNTNFTTRIQ